VPRVLIVGSANVDFIVAVARLPQPGETVSGGSLLVAHGGKGANQAVAARRLEAEVRLLACVGDDAAGRGVRAALEAEGIESSGVHAVAGAATGTAVIVVDEAGRNQIAVAPGANRLLTREMLEARRADFAWADVVVCQLETPLEAVAWALREARACGAVTVLNPAPVPDAPIDFLSTVDYLTPNEGEASRLAGMRVAPAIRAAQALRARGAGTVVVTRGDAGALACTGQAEQRVRAYRVTALDTTGAGDAFNGALAVALAERRQLGDALDFASAAAALACTRRGAQPSLPTRSEVDRFRAAHAEERAR